MGERGDQLLHEVEFVHDWYRSFLERLQSRKHRFRTFEDAPAAGDVFLRHDVDLSLDAAVRMARIEAELGIQSTYFVLLSSPLYNVFEGGQRSRVREIAELGHEIGLHFSTHGYWSADDSPDAEAIETRVAEERAVLETVAPEVTEAISFHIPPSWVLGRSFDGFPSAYAPAYFEEIDYVADSGQRWRDEPPAIGDGAVQILTHPGLWAETDSDFEGRIDQAVVEACQHANRQARLEFVDEVDDV